MQSVGQNLNFNYGVKAKVVEQKPEDEKGKTNVKDDAKGVTQGGYIPEKVDSSALDALAFQNQGLIELNKKHPVADKTVQTGVTNSPLISTNPTSASSVKEEKYRDQNYNSLVALWNDGDNDLSLDEQFWLLEDLWNNAPTNEDKGHWAYLQQQINTFIDSQALQAAIEGFQNGTLDPAVVYDGYPNGNSTVIPSIMGCGIVHCYDAMVGRNMEGISRETQIAMLYERIAYIELMLLQAQVALDYNPYVANDPYLLQELEWGIGNLNDQLVMCNKRIAELEGGIPKIDKDDVINNEAQIENDR